MGQADLVAFERAVFARKREDRQAETQAALHELIKCLQALREGGAFKDHGAITPELCTRMASAVVALFVDPGFRLTQDGFDWLCAERVTLGSLFKASAYGGSDFVFELLEDETQWVNKFLLLYSNDSDMALDWEAVFRGAPQEMIGLYLSLLSYGQVFTERADELREKLIGMASIFDGVRLPQTMYNGLCGAYMHCSYAHGEAKHEPKALLHRLMHDMVAPHVPEFAPAQRRARGKPVLLVIHEWWSSTHAMFRTYSKGIRSLRKHFHTIGMCPGKQTDDAAKAVFDEWTEFEGEPMILGDLAAKITGIAPDMIYYPSIGMSVWAISMSSLRLAPIQVMTYGHPATSNSPYIDYGIIEEDFYSPGCFNERVVTIPANTLRQTPYELVKVRHKPRRTDTIRIGVTAMQVKITWPMMRAIQDIQRRAEKVVEVIFMSAAYGVGLYSLSNGIGKLVANAEAHERDTYENYMQLLAGCDIALFSFPFGGWNSTIDAMTLGIPMVSFEGEEPHSRSDACLMRRAGLPELLIAHTEKEYADAVLYLMDDRLRADIARKIRKLNVPRLFFREGKESAFADAFDKIYREHTLEQHYGHGNDDIGRAASGVCASGE